MRFSQAKKLVGVSGLAISCALSMGAGVSAQETEPSASSAEADVVVVTARRREEASQDVPIALTAISGDELADSSIDTLDELVSLVPGAMTANLGAAFSNEIILRGQGAGRNVNAEGATGIYRNGIYVAGGNIGGRNFNQMDLFDIERVEALRGPQGALFGRNAVGGAINMVSRRPDDEFGYDVSLGYGINERVEAHAIINVPLNDRVAIRAGAMHYDQDDGFFTDRVTGAPQDVSSFLGGRVSLAADFENGSTLNLLIERFEDDGASFTIGTFNPNAAGDPYSSSSTNYPFNFNRLETTFIGEFSHEFGWGDWTTIVLHRSRDAETFDDVDAFSNILPPGPQGLTRYSSNDFTRTALETRLASSGNAPLSWLIGAEISDSEDRFELDSNNGARTSSSVSTELALAAFGSVGYQFTDRLTGTIEARLTSAEKEATILSRLSPVAPQRTSQLSETFTNLSPKISLTYEFSERVTGYANIASGYRSGGFNPEPDDRIPERFALPFDDESIISYEAGIKLRPASGVTFDAAVYYSVTDDIQLLEQFPAATGGQINSLTNAGQSTQFGVEIDASFRHEFESTGAWLTMIASAAIADAEIESPLARYDGYTLPYLRDVQASLRTTYRHPIGAYTLFANHTVTGGWGGYQDEASGRVLDDIVLNDIRLGIETERWSLIGTVENVFDEFYVPQRVAPTIERASTPREWMITFRIQG